MKAGSFVQPVRDFDGNPGKHDGFLDRQPHSHTVPAGRAMRMLRLRRVLEITGLGKTTIYQLQATGSFPMRVQLTAHSVAWVEEEVLAWLARRAEARP
jgi:prophage regulatory protein